MLTENKKLGVMVDFGRQKIDALALEDWKESVQAMRDLEAGVIANPSEKRQVGHYWLRDPARAPKEYAEQIHASWEALDQLVARIPAEMTSLLMVGIGGSALGPQFLVDALESHRLQVYFLDNTDPAGIDRVLRRLDLTTTVVAVLSKSGGTKETRNALLETQQVFKERNIPFAEHAIAVTCLGSQLYQQASDERWLGILPLWNWVGGRTSITGMVGLLPLALMSCDWKAFLQGAAEMDRWTRELSEHNPALQMAHGWYELGNGKGEKNLVVLPYKDSLLLFGRYLQQLIMESIGKKYDEDGNCVHQGLTVYGNKGSTDQHAFVQQLRDGRDDFFVHFVAVLKAREGKSIEVEEGITAGDYLLGFMLGTRNALSEAGRSSSTVVLSQVDERTLGALIALYERVVGYYASRVGINAYDQPGVEAGKKAAGEILALQKQMMAGEDVPDNDDTLLLRRYLAQR